MSRKPVEDRFTFNPLKRLLGKVKLTPERICGTTEVGLEVDPWIVGTRSLPRCIFVSWVVDRAKLGLVGPLTICIRFDLYIIGRCI